MSMPVPLDTAASKLQHVALVTAIAFLEGHQVRRVLTPATPASRIADALGRFARLAALPVPDAAVVAQAARELRLPVTMRGGEVCIGVVLRR
jgi:hypothetical protein